MNHLMRQRHLPVSDNEVAVANIQEHRVALSVGVARIENMNVPWCQTCGEKEEEKNSSWSPLSHALHSLVTAAIIRVLKTIQNQRGNRGPVIGEDMKLPAQTSVAGARVGFVGLWNLGVLCINTHM